MTMSSSRILVETALFFVLLSLISIQVVIYWACSRDAAIKMGGEQRLGINEAWLVLENTYYTQTGASEVLNFTFSQVSDNCYKCNFTDIATIPFGKNFTFIMDTTFPTRLQVRNDRGEIVCHRNKSYTFDEGSLYYYTVKTSTPNNVQCLLSCGRHADNAFLPILYAAVVIVSLSVVWVVLVFTHRYMKEKGCFKSFHLSLVDRLTHRDLGLPSTVDSGKRYRTKGTKGEKHPILNSSYASSSVAVLDGTNGSMAPSNQSINSKQEDKMKSKRLISLDAFRGMSLVIMIFVNYGGGGYWFFNHSKWNGLTVADLVFPWFIWIMGVSLVFSFRGRKKDSFPRQLYQVIRRSVILFAVGLFLNVDEDTPISLIRIPGVLQRFSITYLVVALTEILTNLLYQKKNFTLWNPLKDITNNWVQWVMVLLLEALWLMLTFLVTAKGCPRGYLGPGGISNGGQYYNCTGGAAGAIDRWLLGNNHIYSSPTAKHLYRLDLNYDPEGVLGSLNSIVLCYFGVQAGRTLLHFRGKHLSVFVRFIIWGLSLSVLGTVLCLGQKNGGIIPLNKNLWSLSFILVMGGTGYLLLALFYLSIDVIHWWNGSPFKYPGMNSIIVYVGHELLGGYFPFGVYNQEQSHLTFLAANLVAVSIWMLISYYWFSIGFFVKV